MEWVFEADTEGDFLDQLFGVTELFRRGIHLQATKITVRGLVVEAAKQPTQVCLIDLAFFRDLFQGP